VNNHLYDHKDDIENDGYFDDPLPIAMPMIMLPDHSDHEPIKLNDGGGRFDRNNAPVPVMQPMNREPIFEPQIMENNQFEEPIAMPMAMPMNFDVPQIMEMNQPMSTDGEDPFMAMPFAMPMAMNLDLIDPIESS